MAMKSYVETSVNTDPKKLEVDEVLANDMSVDADAGIPDTPVYHGLLKGRDYPNQHPITSIIGLQAELDNLREYAESRGESAYEIAVRNGFVGTEIEWLSSLQGIQGIEGVDIPRLQIESTKGNIFKNSEISTVLRIVIYYGLQAIRSYSELVSTFGANARLRWYCQSMNSDVYYPISEDDMRLTDGGFALAVSPSDVETKATFKCELLAD